MAEQNLCILVLILLALNFHNECEVALVAVLGVLFPTQRLLQVDSQLVGYALGSVIVLTGEIVCTGQVLTVPGKGDVFLLFLVITKAKLGVRGVSALCINVSKTDLQAVISKQHNVLRGSAIITVDCVNVECHVQILTVPAPVSVKETALYLLVQSIGSLFAVAGGSGNANIVFKVFKTSVLVLLDLTVQNGGDCLVRNVPLHGSLTCFACQDLVVLLSGVLIQSAEVEEISSCGNCADCRYHEQSNCQSHQFFHVAPLIK